MRSGAPRFSPRGKSKRYYKSHYFRSFASKTCGPYGEVTASTLADAHFIRVSNTFDIGFQSGTGTTLPIDISYNCNQFIQYSVGSGESAITDGITSMVASTTTPTTNAIYPAANEIRVRPVGWTQSFTPYQLYTVQACKITMRVRPQMTDVWDLALPTMSDRAIVGFIADNMLASGDWFSYNINVLGIDSSNWRIFKQYTRKEIPPQVWNKGFKISLYVSLPKYFQVSPDEYNTNVAQFAGTIGYDPDSNDVASVTQPATTPIIHFAFAKLCSAVNGGLPSASSIAWTGSMSVKYWVRLSNPDPVVALFHPGTGK